MICELCEKNQATIVYTHIVDNEKKTVHICGFCASKENGGDAQKTPSADMTAKMKVALGSIKEGGNAASSACPQCGLTYEEFKKGGRFGCHLCYTAFAGQLERLLERIHGATNHNGKELVEVSADSTPEDELAHLREELQTAVAAEAFEKAAELRDHIAELEKEIERAS